MVSGEFRSCSSKLPKIVFSDRKRGQNWNALKHSGIDSAKLRNESFGEKKFKKIVIFSLKYLVNSKKGRNFAIANETVTPLKS